MAEKEKNEITISLGTFISVIIIGVLTIASIIMYGISYSNGYNYGYSDGYSDAYIEITEDLSVD